MGTEMTDNSDFMARYLRPDDSDRREHPAPPPVDDEEAKIVEPQMPAPASPQQPPAGGPEFAPPPPGLAGGDEGVRARPVKSPPAADTGPLPQAPGGPGAGQWSAPRGRAAATAFPQPPSIPPRPRFDQGAPPPLPEEWAPRVDPAERWAPRADPRAVAPDVDRHIQVEEVVKQRREPAEMGWRKTVYVSTGRLVNLGAGPAERRLHDWRARITANIPGNYQIAAVSVKGGVGKTRVTAGVGSVFAELRKQPVIAIDANPTYGGLGRLIDPRTQTSVREFLAADDLVDYPKARFYTGQNKQGLEVLAGNQNVANPLALEGRTFTATVSRTRRFYQLALIDCGAEIEHPMFPAVLSASDSLMIVGSCSVEGGLAVETTIDWLAARNGHELLKRSVVVLNDAYRCASTNFITHVTETLGKRVHSVKTVPWDAHLRDAPTLDFPALQRRTRLAFIELAAELAGGFPTAGALAG
jgi:MinD-like ATPase involved in chromosome partitioning or flagellar assembly